MQIFKGDLFRSFAVGFVLGALGLVVAMSGGTEDAGLSMVSHAVAAPVTGN